MPLCELDGVTRRYGALAAVDGVSLTIEAGEICGLVGPNGSGKTTLINLMSGIVPPSGGRIQLEAHDVTRLRGHDIARLGVRRTFQLVRLQRQSTVRENVLAGLISATDDSRRSGFSSAFRLLGSKKHFEQVDEVIERVELTRWASRSCNELPFGIARRTELGRALISKPKLLLLDEPVAGVADDDIEILQRVIVDEAARGCGVVLVDHNLGFVLQACPRLVVMNFGRTIFDGPSTDAISDQGVREAYVGG